MKRSMFLTETSNDLKNKISITEKYVEYLLIRMNIITRNIDNETKFLPKNTDNLIDSSYRPIDNASASS
jgi:hypothetical protein